MRQERILKTHRRRPQPTQPAALVIPPAPDLGEADDVLTLIDAILADA